MKFTPYRELYSMFIGKWAAVFWNRFTRNAWKRNLNCVEFHVSLRKNSELKAVKEIDDVHRAQVFNYLKATGLRLGLLVNFGHYPKATVERIIM